MSTASNASGRASLRPLQSAPQITPIQIGFDLVFGIALPLVCLSLDEFVFQSPHGNAFLGRYTIFAGVAGGLGIVSLAAWHLIRRPPALFAGLLCGAALFATLLGMALLPYSIFGLFFDRIALLGLSPFATAFVFWRNAIRPTSGLATRDPRLAFACSRR